MLFTPGQLHGWFGAAGFVYDVTCVADLPGREVVKLEIIPS